MKIRVNRNRTEPPPRDYSKRNTMESSAERLTALTTLLSLDPGQSVEFTGDEVSRDRVNSWIVTLGRRGHLLRFSTAKVQNGIGVWRTA